MAHYTGKDVYISYKGTAVSGDQRTMSVNESMDTAETSAGADTDRSYLATLKDAKFDITVLDNGTAGSAIRALLAVGTAAGTLLYAPNGTAAGMPRYRCQAFVTSFTVDYPYDGEVEIEVEWQRSGAWTYNYEVSGSVFP